MYHTLGVNLNSWANISIQLEYLSRHLHMDRRALIFNFFNIQKVHLKCNIKYLKNNACENSYHKRKANIQRYINVDYQFKFFICWSYFIPFESLFHSSRSKTEYMHWNFNKRQEECDLEVKKKSYYRFQNLNIWDKYYKMMEKLYNLLSSLVLLGAFFVCVQTTITNFLLSFPHRYLLVYNHFISCYFWCGYTHSS